MKMRGPILASYAAHAFTAISSFLSVRWFLAGIGVEDYGYWGALLGVSSYLALLNFGVAQTVLSRFATSAPDPSPDRRAALVREGLERQARASGMAIAPALALSWWVPWERLFHLPATKSEMLAGTAVLVSLTMLLELPFQPIRAAVIGLGLYGFERAVSTVVVLLRLAVAFASTRTSLSLPILVVLLSLSNMVGHLALYTLLRIKLGVPIRGTIEPADAAAFGTASRGFFALQITGLVVSNIDPFLAGVLLDVEASARISLAWRVISTLTALATLLQPATGTQLVAKWAAGDRKDSLALGIRINQLAFGVMVGIACCLMGSGESLVLLWVGPGLYVGHVAWVAYCLVLLLSAAILIPEVFVYQASMHATYARWAPLEIVIKILVTLTCVPLLGVAALPLGMLAGRGLVTARVLIRTYSEAMDYSPRRWLLDLVAPVPYALLACVLAQLLFGGVLPDQPVWRVVGSVLSGGIYLTVFAVSLPRETLRALLPKRRLTTAN